jgi:hypothetical protein
VDEGLAWDSTSTFLDFSNCTNDSYSKEDLREEEENADDNLYEILPIIFLKIKELNNHNINQVVED